MITVVSSCSKSFLQVMKSLSKPARSVCSVWCLDACCLFVLCRSGHLSCIKMPAILMINNTRPGRGVMTFAKKRRFVSACSTEIFHRSSRCLRIFEQNPSAAAGCCIAHKTVPPIVSYRCVVVNTRLVIFIHKSMCKSDTMASFEPCRVSFSLLMEDHVLLFQ